MTTPSWPVTVNQGAKQEGFGEAPERNVASFQPDVGPSSDRRRSALANDDLSFTGWFSSAEWDALVDFYRNTLLDGILSFTRNHPRTGISGTFKFTDAPKISQVMGLTYVVLMSMISFG